MSDWTERWRAKHSGFVNRNKDIKSVLEHRYVEQGEIYLVGLNGGGYQTRHYVDGKLKAKTPFVKQTEAVKAYRALRDSLVPNRAKVTKKEVAKPTSKATTKSKPKAQTSKAKAKASK